MRKDMQVQIRMISVDKWNEGCKIKKDPGRKYIFLLKSRKNKIYFPQLTLKARM